jgi:hypothetical protein
MCAGKTSHGDASINPLCHPHLTVCRQSCHFANLFVGLTLLRSDLIVTGL